MVQNPDDLWSWVICLANDWKFRHSGNALSNCEWWCRVRWFPPLRPSCGFTVFNEKLPISQWMDGLMDGGSLRCLITLLNWWDHSRSLCDYNAIQAAAAAAATHKWSELGDSQSQSVSGESILDLSEEIALYSHIYIPWLPDSSHISRQEICYCNCPRSFVRKNKTQTENSNCIVSFPIYYPPACCCQYTEDQRLNGHSRYFFPISIQSFGDRHSRRIAAGKIRKIVQVKRGENDLKDYSPLCVGISPAEWSFGF